ncbi:MAG: hypothetical protein GXO48_03360 [Chlorobi bacterium]|nr:hypothetical protein [Chlorobiota bacterium]
MEKGSIALRVKKILLEHGFDREQAEALALVFDDVYHSQMSEVATKDDIKAVREDIRDLREDMKMFIEMTNKRFEDMNKRFEDLLHYMDRRFEAMDKRFEDMNKRFSFMQWVIVILFSVYTGIVTFITTYVLPQILK